MAELAICTFIKLKVLDAIPRTGSISLEDLSKATGAQESLLGMVPSYIPLQNQT
jgi:hypothetical protein